MPKRPVIKKRIPPSRSGRTTGGKGRVSDPQIDRKMEIKPPKSGVKKRTKGRAKSGRTRRT